MRSVASAREGLTDELLVLGGYGGVVATLIGSLFGYPFVHHVWEPFVYAMVLCLAPTGLPRKKANDFVSSSKESPV